MFDIPGCVARFRADCGARRAGGAAEVPRRPGGHDQGGRFTRAIACTVACVVHQVAARASTASGPRSPAGVPPPARTVPRNLVLPLVLLLAAASTLAGCTGTTERARAGVEAAQRTAAEAGLDWEPVDTGPHTIATARRGVARARTLVVYIEGDGRAWESRRRVSADPTPARATALRLAARDRSPALLYLARPCQFLVAGPDETCDPRQWTSHRYAGSVVDTLETAMDDVVRRDGGAPETLVLVGYSGGGTLAALLAARRTDVACLITVAANLDIEAWSRLHGVDPLSGSDNPAALGPALAGVPQVHLAGADDAVVPAAVIASYVEALARSDPRPTRVRRESRVVVLPGRDHDCCWEGDWPAPLAAASPPVSGDCTLPAAR